MINYYSPKYNLKYLIPFMIITLSLNIFPVFLLFIYLFIQIINNHEYTAIIYTLFGIILFFIWMLLRTKSIPSKIEIYNNKIRLSKPIFLLILKNYDIFIKDLVKIKVIGLNQVKFYTKEKEFTHHITTLRDEILFDLLEYLKFLKNTGIEIEYSDDIPSEWRFI